MAKVAEIVLKKRLDGKTIEGFKIVMEDGRKKLACEGRCRQSKKAICVFRDNGRVKTDKSKFNTI